jgi:hypothetical protein
MKTLINSFKINDVTVDNYNKYYIDSITSMSDQEKEYS